MIATCLVCNRSIKYDDDCVQCDSCRADFHYSSVKERNCSSLSTTEYRATVLFFCDECREAFKRAPVLVRSIEMMQNKISILEAEITELKRQKMIQWLRKSLKKFRIVNTENAI